MVQRWGDSEIPSTYVDWYYMRVRACIGYQSGRPGLSVVVKGSNDECCRIQMHKT